MKILHTVEQYFPSIGGMQEAVKQISENLVSLGHEVTVVTSKDINRRGNILNGVKIVDFSIKGNLVDGFQGDIKKYHRFLLHSNFDVIVNFAAQQWSTDGLLEVMDKIKSKKVFVPTGFSGLYLPKYKIYFRKMEKWMGQYDMNVFLSDDYRDINYAKNHRIKNIRVIPNGASYKEFSKKFKTGIREKLGIPPGNYLLLHVGSHTGLKGHKELISIFKKANIKNATLLIVGNTYSRRCYYKCKFSEILFNKSSKRSVDKKQLINIALSREETISAYQQADLFLFVSNIECSPVVLFECMASRTPFLTSDVGNSKEIVKWSKSGILLPTKKNSYGYSQVNIIKSANILEELLTNGQKRGNMAFQGFEAWKKNFTWEKITLEYEKVYKKTLD